MRTPHQVHDLGMGGGPLDDQERVTVSFLTLHTLPCAALPRPRAFRQAACPLPRVSLF